MAWTEKKGSGDCASFRDLVPTLQRDGQVIPEVSGKQESLRNIQADVLLLGGSKSSTFMNEALDEVEKFLPRTKRVEITGLDHGSGCNREMRGKPTTIPEELRCFFT
jgi:hypothetical protein